MQEEVVIRHAASNQLQRNGPHCKPPAAPKRSPDRRQTAPAPACAYPALRLAITDEASPFALRSTRNRPRRAMRRGAAWSAVRHQTAAWSLPWLRSRWQSCRRRADLGCQAANAGPQEGSACPGGPPCGRGDRDVRTPSVLFIRSLSASLAVRMACRVEWTVSGRTRRGRRCPNACPIVASMVDAGHDRADIGQGPGLWTFRHPARVQVSRGTGPDAGSGWDWRREPALAVVSGQGQDV